MHILTNIQDSTLRGFVSICEKCPSIMLTVFDNTIPVFDIFDNVKPDLYITKNNILDRATLKYLLSNTDIKTCIIQTSNRNFYGKELEKNNRITYSLEDKPAADIIAFGGGGTHINDINILAITDLISGNTFVELEKQINSGKFRAYGNRMISSPYYLGQIDYKDLKSLFMKSSYVLCDTNTDLELNATISSCPFYLSEKPTIELDHNEIMLKLNYSVKLADILKNTGFPTEGELCLQTLNSLQMC